MPKEPPAAGRVGMGGIVRVTTKEVAVIMAIGRAVSRGEEGLREVDLDEIPAWPKGTCGSVGDEEEAVRGQKDGGMKRITVEWNGGDRWIGRRADRDSSSSGNGDSRKGRGRR